jgi:hypothetical protein
MAIITLQTRDILECSLGVIIIGRVYCLFVHLTVNLMTTSVRHGIQRRILGYKY